MQLSTERLQEIWEVRNQCSTHVEAAEILGIAESTLRGHLNTIKEKAKRGELGFKAVLPGFELYKTTDSIGKDGVVKGSHRSQRLAREEKLVPPENLELVGLSAYTDGQDNIIGKWNLYRKGKEVETAIREAIKVSFDEYQGRGAIEPYRSVVSREDLLTIYNIGDHHLGLFAWGKETGGDNCDLNIGRKLLLDTIDELVDNAPSSEKCIILSLGDFFHTNGKGAITEASGNLLDRDGRWAKVYRIGVDMAIELIKSALRKHRYVEVRMLNGNHDDTSSYTLSVALAAFFHDEPRVTIDLNPGFFWYHEFGKVMLSATHGHEAKPEQMPGIMAANQAQMWGRTIFRYCYLGHIHHWTKRGDELNGAKVETFQILPPHDAWHASKFPLSGRSMCAITHHKNRGEYLRHTVSIVPGEYDEG
jgi:hypothetical protein